MKRSGLLILALCAMAMACGDDDAPSRPTISRWLSGTTLPTSFRPLELVVLGVREHTRNPPRQERETLLRPVWWVLPLGIAVPIVDAVLDGQLSFIGFASTVTAVIGAIQAPIRVLFGDWRFTLATRSPLAPELVTEPA